MGRQFSKGAAFQDAQLKRFNDMKMTAKQGHRDMAMQGLADAKELTSGSLTPSQTRGAFARGASPKLSTPDGRQRVLTTRQRKNRNLKGSVKPLPINVQTGKLRESMSFTEADSKYSQAFDVGPGEGAGGAIYVLSPSGTKRMIARTYWAEVAKRWRARNLAFLLHFIRKTH